MNHPNVSLTHDTEERHSIILIQQGRAAIKVDCYDDDDEGTGIIEISETTPGIRSRLLAHVADGAETQLFYLDQMGRERVREIAEDHHPSPDSLQRAIELVELMEDR